MTPLTTGLRRCQAGRDCCCLLVCAGDLLRRPGNALLIGSISFVPRVRGCRAVQRGEWVAVVHNAAPDRWPRQGRSCANNAIVRSGVFGAVAITGGASKFGRASQATLARRQQHPGYGQLALVAGGARQRLQEQGRAALRDQVGHPGRDENRSPTKRCIVLLPGVWCRPLQRAAGVGRGTNLRCAQPAWGAMRFAAAGAAARRRCGSHMHGSIALRHPTAYIATAFPARSMHASTCAAGSSGTAQRPAPWRVRAGAPGCCQGWQAWPAAADGLACTMAQL